MDAAPQLAPVDRAKALGPAIAAAADAIEATQRIPEPLLTDLYDARLWRLFLPRNLGGEETHPVAYLEALIEVSRHDGSVGWNMFVANSSTLLAPFLPFESAKTIWGDPRTVICWGPPNGCRLKAVEGGYRVDGEWDFASGSRQANWAGAHAPVEEPDGALRLNALGKPLIRSAIFPVGHAEFLDKWNPIGLKGTASDSYRVRDLFVPEAFSGTREEPETRRDPGPLYAFTMQGLYAVGVAGVALGIARAMLAEFAELAGAKTPRGRSRLADDALTQADFARAESKLGAGFAYLVHVLNDIYDRADEWAVIGVEDRGAGPPRLQHGHPERRRGRRLGPPRRRRLRHLPRLALRAALPRHAHPFPADPVPPRPFRGGRPGPARQPAARLLLTARMTHESREPPPMTAEISIDDAHALAVRVMQAYEHSRGIRLSDRRPPDRLRAARPLLWWPAAPGQHR